MLGRHQARIDLESAGADGEVVEAAAELAGAVLDDPDPPALGAVFGRQFLQPDHPVGHAVHGLVQALGGEIVEQQHGGAAPGEIVLQGQHLPAVAKRALGQQPDLREAVDHDPTGTHGLHLIEDHPGGLAQLQVRGIEQALLLLLIEQAFRRRQFEDLHPGQVPAVGQGGGAQLRLGFRQGDVEAGLALRGACAQEAHGGCGLAGSGAAFEQIDPLALEATHQDVVEAGDPHGGVGYAALLIPCHSCSSSCSSSVLAYRLR